MVELDVDPDLADHFDLGKGKLGRDLVRGNAEGVESARKTSCFVDDDVVPQSPQLMGAAQAGWPRADDGHALAGGRSGEESRSISLFGNVAGMALEPADLNGRLHQHMIDAGAFAQHFGGASTGAASAKDIGVKDREGGADLVAMQDLPDEPGNVDVRRAGPGAGSVEAKQAARCLDPCLVKCEGRRRVGKTRVQFFKG